MSAHEGCSSRVVVEPLEEPAHSILWRFRLGPNPCGPSSRPHRKSPHLYNTADEIDRLLELP